MTSLSTTGAQAIAQHDLRPSFLGLMRGEWLKISRLWSFWIMLGLMVAGMLITSLIFGAAPDLAANLKSNPRDGIYSLMEVFPFLLRVFWGMMIIILTARLIGMEYSGGTIRVVLARGVGRLQLLAAKLSVITLVAIIAAALLEVFGLICGLTVIGLAAHNLDVLKAADTTFWSDSRTFAASVLISLGVSILLAAAMTTLTRSLAVGLSVSMIWFPIDNMSVILLSLGALLTKWSFWSLVSGDFLGLNLNVMPTQILSTPAAMLVNTPFVPLTPVTGAHTLLVTAIYAVVFAAVAIFFTVRPDVKE